MPEPTPSALRASLEKHALALSLLVIFSVLLFFTNGLLYQHALSHPSPVGYSVADGYGYLMLSEAVRDAGNARYYPWYEAYGYHDVLMVHPPNPYTIPVLFASLSGLELYDAQNLLFAIMLSTILAIAVLITWDFNPKVAIIGAGFSAFFLTGKFLSIYTWGQVGAMVGFFFLAAIIWALWRAPLKHSGVFLTLLFVSGILGHIPEIVYAAIIFAIFFLVRWSSEGLRPALRVASIVLLSILVAVVITADYVWMFIHSFLRFQGAAGGAITHPEAWTGIPMPFVTDFTWPIILLLAVGFVTICLHAWKRRRIHPAEGVAAVFFLLMFTNYIGVGYRSIHIRDISPLFLGALFGIGVYAIIKLIWKRVPLLAAAAVGVAGFIVILSVAHFVPNTFPGCMDEAHYKAVQFARTSTDPTASFFFFFGDCYSQSARLYPRPVYNINAQDYFQSLQEGKIRRNYTSELMYFGADSKLMYATGFWRYAHHVFTDNITLAQESRDICQFDYFVIDTVSNMDPRIGQANQAVAKMLNDQGAQVVFHDPSVVILRNTKKGGDCIGSA